MKVLPAPSFNPRSFILATIICCVIVSSATAQIVPQEVKDSLVSEATVLYKSERASWLGTDGFFEVFPDWKDSIGGYFSYESGARENCVFFSHDSVSPHILAIFSFDSTWRPENSIIDTGREVFTPLEHELWKLRTITRNRMLTDTIFKFYRNTGMNPIPLVRNGERKVYVLTAPQEDSLIIFGNDYLLTFDRHDNLLSTKRLHWNPIFMKIPGPSTIGLHNHLSPTSDLITVTDLCTLMLYQHVTNFTAYYVLGEQVVSIWDPKQQVLATMPRSAWENIYNKKK